MQESRTLGHNYVGPGHLLLGLTRSGGPVCEILRRSGLDYLKVREQVSYFSFPPEQADTVLDAFATTVNRAPVFDGLSWRPVIKAFELAFRAPVRQGDNYV